MASLRRASKRRSRKCDFLEKSGSCADTLMSSRNRKPSSPYGSQLVSPPASSGCTIPSSSPDVENYNHDVSEDPMKDKEDEEEEEEEEEQELKQGYPKRMVPSSVSKTEPSTSPPPQILRRVGFEPSLDPLSLLEKVKLLKICCDHGSQFLHCPTSGKHAEEDAWTSIMEKFSTTVRLGFFTKYSDVKKVASKICRNRRKNTKGNVPPQRRPRMGDLDTWIDRWVRIWKCRDLVVNIANAHQSMRETIGEKKFKRIFRHRMDGNELPQDLGGLTLSPPLWKAIQKRIRIEERSLGARHISLFPGQDDSDWSDEDETDEDALPEADDEGLPIQSIEQESQISSSDTPEVIGSTPHREVEGKLDFPGPSPRTQARLDQFERGYTTILKEEQGRTGKQTTILDLANKKQERERPPSTSTSNSEEASEAGVVQWELEEKGLTNPTTRLLASSSDKIEDKKLDDSTSLSIGRSTPPPGEVDVQRNTSTNPTRSQRLKPGTYCHGEEVLNLANDEPGGQENTAITPSGSCSKKRTRCQSMTNSSSSSSSNSCTSSFNVLTVPQALNSTTSTRNEHSAKRPRPPPPSEHVQTPVPIPNLTNNGLKPFWRPGTEAIARNNSATDKEHGRMGVRPLDKGKGKATQPHAQNKPSMYPQSSNGKSYAPKWKTDARDTAPSHRFYPYGQPGSSTGPATSQNRRKNGGGGKRDHYRGKDRYNRTSGGNYRNRFLREVTTDTVDFENFSLDRKCDFLRRKMSRMEEMLRKIEKD
ncbi:hypothetical protein F4805DRAFT_469518 [Annulohypoxylon moriforme]|nr:hypothetical protein F4805DRAFT_469518 [Annulohypoxylon moriforme]